jgi:hypothetical protein
LGDVEVEEYKFEANLGLKSQKKPNQAGCQWLKPVILAIQEAVVDEDSKPVQINSS